MISKLLAHWPRLKQELFHILLSDVCSNQAASQISHTEQWRLRWTLFIIALLKFMAQNVSFVHHILTATQKKSMTVCKTVTPFIH